MKESNINVKSKLNIKYDFMWKLHEFSVNKYIKINNKIKGEF
jgi:hypothetical protein